MLQTKETGTEGLSALRTDGKAGHGPVKPIILWKGPTLKEQQKEAGLPSKRSLNMVDVTEKSCKVTITADGTTQVKHTFAFVNFDKRVMIKVRHGQTPRDAIEGEVRNVLLNQIRYLMKTTWQRPVAHPLARIFQPQKWLWKKTGVELLKTPKEKTMQEHVAFICVTI